MLFRSQLGFKWNSALGLNEATRKAFSINTCSGCHSGETGTVFLHVTNRSSNSPAAFSAFLNQDLDDGLGGGRKGDMKTLLFEQNCK